MSPEGSPRADRDRLFADYAADPSEINRNAIVESFIPLAEFFASRYRDRGVDAEDLRQVAKLALVKAVDRFDPGHDVAFSTFAGRTIDGELKRHFRDKTWAVRVPRSLQERSLHVRRAADELATRLGVSPTAMQIADETGLAVDEVIEALDVRQAYRADTIDSTPSEDDPSPPIQQLSVDDGLELTDTRMALQSLLAGLPERERQILQLRFFDELSQADIAEQVGVSQMHVSRLIRRSLEEMRASISASG